MAEALDRDELSAIRDALLQWRDQEGVVDPIMRAYTENGDDDLPDFYGLDSLGRIELRPDGTVGTDIAEVFGAEGEDGEGP